MKTSRTETRRTFIRIPLILLLLLATLLPITAAIPISAAFNHSPAIEDGKSYCFLTDNLKALNVYGYPTDGRTSAGLCLNDFDAEGNEIFVAHVTKKGIVLRAKYDPLYVLNIYGGASARIGDQLKVYRTSSPDNDAACLFSVCTTTDGYVNLYNSAYGKYVGLEGSGEGARVILTNRSGAAKFRCYEVVDENSDVLEDGNRYGFVKYGSANQGLNIQYAPTTGSTASVVLDPVTDRQGNETWIAHRVGSAWYFEAAYRKIMLNALYGADCRSGNQAAAYASSDPASDRACLFAVLRDDRGILFFNLAARLFVDSYGRNYTGARINFYGADTLSSNDQLWTPVLIAKKSAEPDVVYRQTESKWKNVEYGKGANMYDAACGVFAVCNAVHAISGYSFSDADIKSIAKYAVDKGYRIVGSGTSKELAVGMAKDYGSKYGFKTGSVLYYQKGRNASVIASINDVLDKGGAICFSVNSSAGGHIVTITGRRVQNGVTQYMMVDSYPSANRLGGSYGWVTMDSELDLHTEAGKKIVTKGSLGFYTLLPR